MVAEPCFWSARARSFGVFWSRGRVAADALRHVFFDTHCHFDFDEFANRRDQLIGEARARGVTELLVPGVAPEHWKRQADVVDTWGLRSAFGVHPFWAESVTPESLTTSMSRLESCLKEHGAVAVGECGLDALHAKRRGESLEWQVAVFEEQLALAKNLRLPVVIHCVRAHGRLLQALRRAGPLPQGGVLHAYSGSAEMVRQYAQYGLYFGFGGAVTKSRSKRAAQALLAVPFDRLLLETDAPDQAPAWCDGTNEPAELARIAEVIAGLLSTQVDDLAAQTLQNGHRLFQLSPAGPGGGSRLGVGPNLC